MTSSTSIISSKLMLFAFLFSAFFSCKNKAETIKKETIITNDSSGYYHEPYRPQFHFSPEEKWMNDPNGMVFHKGIYHLFYQYYPDDIVWGPMHWGHATSTNLVQWTHKPIALYPDELGYIFSGSAVVDKTNSSGFGSVENPPLVAIYTYHDMEGEKAKTNTYQTQGLAYSLDNGDTWVKYQNNPIIGNTGIKDFRDPKVFWHHASSTWVMTLVAGDHAQFYNSTDLKEWKKVGEFGKKNGAHGGVWECPDLIKLKVDDTEEEKWVLLISINPGAPNGGSGTQYFVGDFDGTTFTTNQYETKWIDWGTDNYAGVTFSNTADETIFMGWMSNWAYARDTPTKKWRSAMTVPRNLSLQKHNNGYQLVNYPIKELNTLVQTQKKRKLLLEKGEEDVTEADLNTSEIKFKTDGKAYTITLANNLGEATVLTMDAIGICSLDRRKSGKTSFQADFPSLQKMPISHLNALYEVRILVDQSSIEIFIDKGRYVMTAQLFPNAPYNNITITNTASNTLKFVDYEVSEVSGIWE